MEDLDLEAVAEDDFGPGREDGVTALCARVGTIAIESDFGHESSP